VPAMVSMASKRALRAVTESWMVITCLPILSW
jgi:hypothetical protein